MSYFNTPDTKGQLLIDYETQAKYQEGKVLKAFRILGKPLTCSELHCFLIGSQEIDESTPLTSIRRAVTNLSNEMKLRKTSEKGKGLYGRGEYKYELCNEQQ